MNGCEDYVALMHLYLDDEADADERATLMAHLAQCDHCRGLFEQYRLMTGELRTVPESVPASLHRDIMGHIEKSTTLPWWRRRIIRSAATVAACAAMLVLVFVGGDRLVSRNSANTVAGDTTAAAQSAELRQFTMDQKTADGDALSGGGALTDGAESESLESAPQDAPPMALTQGLAKADGGDIGVVYGAEPYTVGAESVALAADTACRGYMAAVGDLNALPDLTGYGGDVTLVAAQGVENSLYILAQGNGARMWAEQQLMDAGFVFYNSLIDVPEGTDSPDDPWFVFLLQADE